MLEQEVLMGRLDHQSQLAGCVDLTTGADKSRWIDLATRADMSRQVNLVARADKFRLVD